MKPFANRSEEIFFTCCHDRGWIATKIEAPGNRRAPDFIVRAGDITFVAEIKEFHPPANAKTTGRHRPAQKLRKAINNARGQLKGHDCPTMLVVLDTTGSDCSSAENIRKAFLGDGKMRHTPNTGISAVGALRLHDEKWVLEVHANPAAAHPFPDMP